LSDERVISGPSALEFGHLATVKLVESGQGFTAVLCYNNRVAVGVCAGLRVVRKLIAEEISVIRMDNLPESEAAHPAFTGDLKGRIMVFPAQSHPKQYPPAAQIVQRRHPVRHMNGIVHGQHQHGHADANGRREGGGMGQNPV